VRLGKSHARDGRGTRLDVARLHAFLVPKSREAAQRAVKAIRQGVKALAKHPESGRPVDELPPEFREWVIEFGHGAYVALYHYDGTQIVMLAVRHGREAGY
jgi:plasmid stabilization system protein ParE